MTPTVTMIVKFAGDKGGVTVRLMKSDPLTVFITPTKTATDIDIRCRGMQDYCNEWFASGRGVQSLSGDLIFAKTEDGDNEEFIHRKIVYRGFKDVIGKCLIRCYEGLIKEEECQS